MKKYFVIGNPIEHIVHMETWKYMRNQIQPCRCRRQVKDIYTSEERQEHQEHLLNRTRKEWPYDSPSDGLTPRLYDTGGDAHTYGYY